jgi:hypothetical protein
MGRLLAFATTSRSDVVATRPPGLPRSPIAETATPEPIDDTAAATAPGSETPSHDPFTPHDTGPGSWSLRDLSPEERAVGERGRDVNGWHSTHDAFATAAAERAHRAAADSAAAQLGVDNLATTGVVP